MNKVTLKSLDLTIIDSSMPVVLTKLADGLAKPNGNFVVFLEANLLSLAIKDATVRDCLRQADWIFPDGVAVSKLAEMYAGHPVERISGPTFMLKVCEYGQTHNWRHFFYGGTPKSMQILLDNLKQKYPEIQIAGSYTPPFRPLTETEEAEVKQSIDQCRPDFLWVGLGGPKQEKWIIAHREALKVPVMLGVGAAFDFHAGTRPWAPRWVRKLGMEWLFRALSGGRRTFFRNVKCVSVVSCYLMAERWQTWQKK